MKGSWKTTLTGIAGILGGLLAIVNMARSGTFDSTTHEVVTAFQRHFRPERIDGVWDASTRATLQELLLHRNRPRTVAARVINFNRLVIAS